MINFFLINQLIIEDNEKQSQLIFVRKSIKINSFLTSSLASTMAQQEFFNERYEHADYEESRAIKLLDSNDPTVMNEIKLLCDPKYKHDNIIQYYGSRIVETTFLDQEWKKFLAQKYRQRIPAVMIAIELELRKGALLDCILFTPLVSIIF